MQQFEKLTQSQESNSRHKHSPVVAITHDGQTLVINETTAVWLLQENEGVSTDRLFMLESSNHVHLATSPKF